MDKLRDSKGFTLVETMLTLFIVSIILFVTILHIPKYESNHQEDEIKNIKYFLEQTQFDAMAKETFMMVRFDSKQNQVISVNTKTNENRVIKLQYCLLKEGNLNQIIFNTKGDSNSFGTIYLECEKKISKIIFQIQKNRFRIE